jgi:hypothetical protein
MKLRLLGSDAFRLKWGARDLYRCLSVGANESIKVSISTVRHAVVRGPSLTGAGKRPAFTPAHQLERLTGIGPPGARMLDMRRNPLELTIDRPPKCLSRKVNMGYFKRISDQLDLFG